MQDSNAIREGPKFIGTWGWCFRYGVVTFFHISVLRGCDFFLGRLRGLYFFQTSMLRGLDFFLGKLRGLHFFSDLRATGLYVER